MEYINFLKESKEDFLFPNTKKECQIFKRKKDLKGSKKKN